MTSPLAESYADTDRAFLRDTDASTPLDPDDAFEAAYDAWLTAREVSVRAGDRWLAEHASDDLRDRIEARAAEAGRLFLMALYQTREELAAARAAQQGAAA
jgi:hypothetical protein